MNDSAHQNEFDDLVRRAKGYHVHPLTPGEKAGVLWADAELKRLRAIATRWYLADGTFETLPEEEVIRRRIEAAGVLKRVENWEQITKIIAQNRKCGESADDIVAFLLGKEE